MTIDQAVYKWHTFVPVRFERATTGAPSAERPDLDDRGYRDPDFGPVMGVTADDTVSVRVRRGTIDNSADLWATSTDAAIVSVEDPSNGHLPTGERVTLRIRGHRASGTTPSMRTAKVQIRFGNSTGPILAELRVHVYRRLTVDITPHLVTIRDSSGGGVASLADVATIMSMVSAIWKPCGIAFNVGTTRNEDVTYANMGIVSDRPWDDASGAANAEISRLLNTHYVANSINVYFVNQIGVGNFLGYGFSRPNATRFRLSRPGIILADTDASGVTRDTQYWANDLAHEVGHFLTLEHSGNIQQPNELEDAWARRMLMHPFNKLWGRNPWPRQNADGQTFTNRPLQDSCGYGPGNRGCLLTIKDLPQVQVDAETSLARTCAANSGGPY